MSAETTAEKLARLEEIKNATPGFASLDQRAAECRAMLEVAGCDKLESGNTLLGMTYAACRELLRLYPIMVIITIAYRSGKRTQPLFVIC
jgi:hypothetical protein